MTIIFHLTGRQHKHGCGLFSPKIDVKELTVFKETFQMMYIQL